MPSGQSGMRILSQMLSSPYLESLKEQIAALELLNFDPIMMPDEILVNVGKLFNFAYRFKVPGIANIKIGFENSITGSEEQRKVSRINLLDFNKLKGMVSEKMNVEMARVEKMRMDAIQKMGGTMVNFGGEGE